MNKVKILVDSCSDMDKDIRDKYDIDYCKMGVLWDGAEKIADCDWIVYSAKEMYDALRAGSKLKTMQVPQTEFERIFTKYLQEGYDIVYVACSTALSGSYSTGKLVAETLLKDYPDSHIYCIDTKISCGGQALIAMEAAKYYQKTGASAKEVADFVAEHSKYSLQFATVGSLTYLKNAGRVKAASAFFGNLFGIKPIIISDVKGNNAAVKKVKGRKNALDECINMLKEGLEYEGNPFPVSEQTIWVGNADCIEDAQYCAERIKELIHPKDVYITNIGPCVGISTGPETIGIYGFGKPVEYEGV